MSFKKQGSPEKVLGIVQKKSKKDSKKKKANSRDREVQVKVFEV